MTVAETQEIESPGNASQSRPSANYKLTLLTGSSWSLLYTLLHYGGHSPSSLKGVVFFGESYYAFAAAVVCPLLFLLSFIVVSTIKVSCRLSHYPFALCWNRLHRAYVGPLLVCLVLPEISVYLTKGFVGLNTFAPYFGGLAASVIAVSVYRAARAFAEVSVGRALCATTLSAVLQGLPAGALLR